MKRLTLALLLTLTWAVFSNEVRCADTGKSAGKGYGGVYRHSRSIQEKVFEIWRNPGRFTKNPDVVQLPTGRLLLVYADTDRHLSQKDQVLTLLASDDQGRTWFKHREVARHEFSKAEERLVTPRLSQLRDGRLVVVVDQDDYGHFHEDQPPGILAFWSTDAGNTWSKEENTGIQGFEPDRVVELPDGRLAVCSHLVLGDAQEYAEILSCSSDGGRTWQREAIVAHDGYHRFCEGALVLLGEGKELACVLRETRSAGMPSFVVFSQDQGKTWSKPVMLPFAFHRPYAKQLKDGRVLVTGRNVNGGLGTYGWYGDLHEESGRYEVGGPRQQYKVGLTAEALVIENLPDHECRYTLLPPESSKSEIVFEADLKVEGPPGEAVAFMSVNTVMTKVGPLVLWIAPDWIALSDHGVDFHKPVDMTRYRKLTLHHRRGLLQVMVDDKVLISSCVFWESYAIKDAIGGDVTKRTQFGQWGEKGRSFWKRVSYSVKNPTLPAFEWAWKATDGGLPDQYQREHLFQIHGNPPNQKESPNHRPDHGYSSWLELKDGRIFLADYTNFGDRYGNSHLVGVYIDPADLAPREDTSGLPVALANEIQVGGLRIQPALPPRGLRTDSQLGVVLNDSMQASLLYYRPGYRADVVRAVRTPGGDFLAVITTGPGTTGGQGHYAPAKMEFHRKANDFIAYRSSDRGKTWSGPSVLFEVPYSMHGFVPLIPSGSKRIYCFGTEPVPDLREGRENAPIGFRYSDDDGRTWSAPTLIRPINDPGFTGMSCTQMTETETGAWLIGSHAADWTAGGKATTWGAKKSGLSTRQYLLRSDDRGMSWRLLPDARPNGWFVPEFDRMDEGRPMALDGSQVLLLTRTPEGHLWELRSDDSGETWTAPKPSKIVHPDAPPMLFKLTDRKTLVVFHHNFYDAAVPHMNGGKRNQLWVTLSSDGGRTWSEPRFVMASANVDRNAQISYVDLLADGGELHLFVPYAWRQTLHVRFRETDLARMPTVEELKARIAEQGTSE